MTLAIVFFVACLILVIAEIFIPSMGLISLMAAIALGLSIWLGFAESTTAGYGILAAAFVLIPTVILVGLRVLPHTALGKLLILEAPDRSKVAPGRDASTAPRNDLVGRDGRTVTDLRPAGLAEVGKRRIDVISAGEWIDADRDITVISVEGNRVLVRAKAGAATAESTETEA